MGYICWGAHFNVEAEEIRHILENGNNFARSVLFGVVCDYFPWAKFFMKKQLNSLETLFQVQKDHAKNLASEHVKSYNGKNLRDIADFFHKVMQTKK